MISPMAMIELMLKMFCSKIQLLRMQWQAEVVMNGTRRLVARTGKVHTKRTDDTNGHDRNQTILHGFTDHLVHAALPIVPIEIIVFASANLMSTTLETSEDLAARLAQRVIPDRGPLTQSVVRLLQWKATCTRSTLARGHHGPCSEMTEFLRPLTSLEREDTERTAALGWATTPAVGTETAGLSEYIFAVETISMARRSAFVRTLNTSVPARR